MTTKILFTSLLEGDNSVFFAPEFEFEALAREVYRFQSEECKIYRSFIEMGGWTNRPNTDLLNIPFLPVEAFKFQEVKSGDWQEEMTFKSSGTTMNQTRSRHVVRSLSSYHDHSIRIFESRFGRLDQFAVLALLPNYLEAGESSLVSMVSAFLDRSGHPSNGFYLYQFQELNDVILQLSRKGTRILLFGVTFALKDFASSFPVPLTSDSLVIETGGMKGRGEELSRSTLHTLLAKQFQLAHIYSEYGMTELLSQAYTGTEGRFWTPPSMKILIKEMNDPFVLAKPGRPGVVHIIDLANVHTCSFLATSDVGIGYEDGSFDIVGRLELADLRGCQLLYV